MGVGARRDHDRPDSRIAECALDVGHLRAVRVGQRFGRRRMPVDDVFQLRAWWRARFAAWILPIRPAPNNANSIIPFSC